MFRDLRFIYGSVSFKNFAFLKYSVAYDLVKAVTQKRIKISTNPALFRILLLIFFLNNNDSSCPGLCKNYPDLF